MCSVCQKTIRLKPGDQTFDTDASAVGWDIIESAYFGHQFFKRSTFFQAFPNDYRSLIQLIVAPGTQVNQNAVAPIEFGTNYLISRN
jgi:hypothetical protein